MVWAVMKNDWDDRDASVQNGAEADPQQYPQVNRGINAEQEHHQAGEEKEQGNVEKRGQCLDYPLKKKLVNSFSKERTDSRSLMRTVTWLSDPDISSCPLLQQGREHCTGETDHQAQEPK